MSALSVTILQQNKTRFRHILWHLMEKNPIIWRCVCTFYDRVAFCGRPRGCTFIPVAAAGSAVFKIVLDSAHVTDSSSSCEGGMARLLNSRLRACAAVANFLQPLTVANKNGFSNPQSPKTRIGWYISVIILIISMNVYRCMPFAVYNWAVHYSFEQTKGKHAPLSQRLGGNGNFVKLFI